MAQKQVKKKPTPKKEEVEVEETKPVDDSTAVEREEKLSELDDLLDEIDDVLEENSTDFVNNYVQKGGQ